MSSLARSPQAAGYKSKWSGSDKLTPWTSLQRSTFSTFWGESFPFELTASEFLLLGMIEVGKTLPRIERWEVTEATTIRLALEKGLSQDP